jgi:hypothetical protein
VRDSSFAESGDVDSAADGDDAPDAQQASDQRLAAIDAELQPEEAALVKVRLRSWMRSEARPMSCAKLDGICRGQHEAIKCSPQYSVLTTILISAGAAIARIIRRYAG